MNKQILVTRSSMPPFEEYIDEIKDMWESHWLTNKGIKHETFREELTKFFDVPFVELLTNGHMAIEMTLQAMQLEGEVITTPFTFASTTHAIVRNNLKPVFCDIREDDFTIDTDKIESLITEKTCAILPVHVYGNICDVEKIDEIARKHNLTVVYDAAHAFGEKYKGKTIASFGDASIFSFHATKVFNTIEGGAVSYSDGEFGRRLYGLKNFGIRDEETVDQVGANAKMNEFCAAMGICNLRHLDEEIGKRKKCYELYFDELKDVKGIRLNPVRENTESNYAYFPVIFSDDFGATRDDVKDELGKNGIFARKYFYPITNDFECYRDLYDVNDTPTAYDISKRVLTLPFYADLDEDTIKRICEIIRGAGK